MDLGSNICDFYNQIIECDPEEQKNLKKEFFDDLLQRFTAIEILMEFIKSDGIEIARFENLEIYETLYIYFVENYDLEKYQNSLKIENFPLLIMQLMQKVLLINNPIINYRDARIYLSNKIISSILHRYCKDLLEPSHLLHHEYCILIIDLFNMSIRDSMGHLYAYLSQYCKCIIDPYLLSPHCSIEFDFSYIFYTGDTNTLTWMENIKPYIYKFLNPRTANFEVIGEFKLISNISILETAIFIMGCPCSPLLCSNLETLIYCLKNQNIRIMRDEIIIKSFDKCIEWGITPDAFTELSDIVKPLLSNNLCKKIFTLSIHMRCSILQILIENKYVNIGTNYELFLQISQRAILDGDFSMVECFLDAIKQRIKANPSPYLSNIWSRIAKIMPILDICANGNDPNGNDPNLHNLKKLYTLLIDNKTELSIKDVNTTICSEELLLELGV